MEATLLVRLTPLCAKDDDRAPVRQAIWKKVMPKIFGITDFFFSSWPQHSFSFRRPVFPTIHRCLYLFRGSTGSFSFDGRVFTCSVIWVLSWRIIILLVEKFISWIDLWEQICGSPSAETQEQTDRRSSERVEDFNPYCNHSLVPISPVKSSTRPDFLSCALSDNKF